MSAFLLRLFAKIKRDLKSIGMLGDPNQFIHWEATKPISPTKLLIIAPGEMRLPTDGWGAVETIISETIPDFQERGFYVTLLNSKKLSLWRKASRKKFDVILCHSDTLISRARFRFPSTPIIAVSHYGFAGFPEKWHSSYKKTLKQLALADYVCALSSQILKVFEIELPGAEIFVSPNGSSFSAEINDRRGGPLVCIGKVEPRKAQYELYLEANASNIEIDFIGEIQDTRVKRLIDEDPTARQRFIGPKSRVELAKILKNYSALILSSRGEADALVLYEAQLAGLPIFVTQEGLGSQDPQLPWVEVIGSSTNLTEISKINESIVVSPIEISKFAQEHYAWKVRNQKLATVLVEASTKGRAC